LNSSIDETRHDDFDSWRQVGRWELTSAFALSGRGGGWGWTWWKRQITQGQQPRPTRRSGSGRDALNDETAQSEREGSIFFSPLKLILDSYSYSESKDSNIFAPGVDALEGRKFIPCGLTTLPCPLLGLRATTIEI